MRKLRGMNTMDKFIIAQIFGILGMTMNILSYQAKKQRNIILMQLLGSFLFVFNMYFLSAIMGCLLNFIGFIRAIVYSNKDKIKNLKIFNVIFIILFVLSYLSVFLVFDTPLTLYNIVIEILPLIAMIATTIGFSKKSAASVRKFAFISSPSWLIYNCFNLSIGGILCEAFSLISVITAMIRLDKKEIEK